MFGYCSECKHMLKVTHTRHTDACTVRRKRCTSCGARSVTYEITAEAHSNFMAALQTPPASPEQSEAHYETALDAEGEFYLERMKQNIRGNRDEPDPKIYAELIRRQTKR